MPFGAQVVLSLEAVLINHNHGFYRQAVVAMRNIFIIALIALSSYSCRERPSGLSDKANLESIVLSKDNRTNPVDMVAGTEVIRLDSKNGLIGRVKNTIVTDNNIVISDENSVFVFDRQGTSQARINRLGRGPEDYIQLTHMTLTPEGDKIAIYDNFGNKVLFFSLSGQYLSSIPAKFWFSSMEYLSSDEVVCVTYGMGHQDPGLADYRHKGDFVFFMNGEFEIESSYMPIVTHTNSLRKTPTLRKFGENVYVNPVSCDTIYLARNNALEAKYHVDMSGIGGEANFADKLTGPEMDALRKRVATFSGFFTDADNHLLLSVGTPPERRLDYYLYSKRSGKVYFVENKPIYNTPTVVADYLKNAVVRDKTSYGDKFVSVIEAYYIADVVKHADPGTASELADITDEDNPVVILYTLKDDL